MNQAIRWRIITLQAVLVLVLAGAGGFAIYEGNFVRGMIHDQLAAQQISFPTTAALAKDTRASEYPAEFKDYVKDTAVQVTDGETARVYANDYLGIHLKEVAGGLTYATIGTKISGLNAQLAAMSQNDPGYADLQKQIATANGQRDTLFKGETLRAMLLNGYGWYTVGTYTLYAGVGLLIAGLGVLAALVFELFFARKPETFKVAQKIAA